MKFFEQTDTGAQDADCIATSGNLSLGIWYKETPELDGRKVGTLGDCSLEDSIEALNLIKEAAEYLNREKKCEIVIGPMNGNTWMKHRLITESTGRPPFLAEPIEPNYLENLFSGAGFTPLSHYSSSIVDLTTPQPDFSDLNLRIGEKGYSVREMSPDFFERDLKIIHAISLQSFSDNFLYTDISEDHFLNAYQAMKELVDPNYVLICEHEGKPAAFLFCIPDALAVQRGDTPSLIVKTLAVLPEHRSHGIGTWLVDFAQSRAIDNDYSEAIHALQFESNSSLRISRRFRAQPFRKYALIAKDFSER